MITFKTFMETGTGFYGEYVNDVPEKTMVNAMINMLFGGVKDEKNYARAYSFIESDTFKDAYDKYYPAFQEKSEKRRDEKLGRAVAPLSAETSNLLAQFKREAEALFNQWKSKNEAK
jgi:hypothetical protein